MSIQEHIISIDRLINLELRRAIAQYSDILKERADQLIDEIGDTGLSETQVNGLLSVVNTSPSVASIMRFIERQGQRREAWQKNDLAVRLLREIKDLLDDAKALAKQIQDRLTKPGVPQSPELNALTERQGRLPEVHYLLVREFIQSFGVGYLYKYGKRSGQGEREEGQ